MFPFIGLPFILKLLSEAGRYIVGMAYCCNRFWLSFKNIIGSKCCWQIRSSCTFALSNRSKRLVFSIQVRHLFDHSEKLKSNEKENKNRFSTFYLSTKWLMSVTEKIVIAIFFFFFRCECGDKKAKRATNNCIYHFHLHS